MNTDSYTSVDRNELLHKIEVMRDALKEFQDCLLKEYRDELAAKKLNLKWYHWFELGSLYSRIKAITAEDLDNDNRLIELHKDLSGWWSHKYWLHPFGECEDLVNDLYVHLTTKGRDATILLSTAHAKAVRELYDELKKGNWIEE